LHPKLYSGAGAALHRKDRVILQIDFTLPFVKLRINLKLSVTNEGLKENRKIVNATVIPAKVGIYKYRTTKNNTHIPPKFIKGITITV